MRITQPKVYLIAEPRINWDAIRRYLESVGGTEWLDRIGRQPGTDSEALVEFAGRACYRSWKEGLNPNVTRVRKNSAAYIGNLLESKHGSVLEHCQLSFMLEDVSRVFTHELVRHRVGVAISQESGRYVRMTDIEIWVPDVLKPFERQIISIVEQVEDFTVEVSEYYGLDNMDSTFDLKKKVTSAIRRLAPFGHSSDMVWSANFRTLRHVLSARTAKGAEEEMRIVFDDVARILLEKFPMIFGDFARDEEGQWVTANWKV